MSSTHFDSLDNLVYFCFLAESAQGFCRYAHRTDDLFRFMDAQADADPDFKWSDFDIVKYQLNDFEREIPHEEKERLQYHMIKSTFDHLDEELKDEIRQELIQSERYVNDDQMFDDLKQFADTIAGMYAKSFQDHEFSGNSAHAHTITRVKEWVSGRLPGENRAGAGFDLMELDVKDNLRSLSINRHALRSIPEFMRENLPQLWFIYMRHNRIERFPENTTFSRDLNVLDISHNNFSEVPPALRGLENLEELNISQNNIAELPNWLLCISKLSKLIANNNQIVDVPASILDTYFLVINLKNNPLRWEGMKLIFSTPVDSQTLRDRVDFTNGRIFFTS